MSAGLPVISLDGKGNRDIVKHKENGYIFPTQNSENFGDAIIELKENPSLYLQIVRAGHQFASEYDIEKYVNKLIDYYNLIIQTKDL